MDDERVEIFHFLDDLNQPYSCSQWGDAGTMGIPPIIDDGSPANTVFNWFENPNGSGIYPLIVFIDHEMKVNRIMGTAPSPTMVNILLENLMNNCNGGFDCLGICGGNAIVDDCGICNGSGGNYECSDGSIACDENSCSNLSIGSEQLSIQKFSLTSIYPNPFNPILNIEYDIQQAGWVKVYITNIRGLVIKTIYDGFKGMGRHQINWDSENYPSGTYFVTLQIENASLTKKVVLLK